MDKSKEVQKYSAPAVRKALEMIELMAASNHSFTLSEIVSQLDITNNSAFRIFKELEAKGYVLKGREDSTYELTPKIYYLGNSIRDRLSFVHSADLYMKRIRKYTKETVIITTMTENYDTLVMDQLESKEAIKFISTIGNSYDSYCSAMGKAMLSTLEEDELNDYFKSHKLTKKTENTIVSEKQLRKELEQIAKDGVAFDREENINGLCCIASPIFSVGGKLEGAIGISGLSFRMPESLHSDYAAFVKEQASKLSNILGYNLRPVK